MPSDVSPVVSTVAEAEPDDADEPPVLVEGLLLPLLPLPAEHPASAIMTTAAAARDATILILMVVFPSSDATRPTPPAVHHFSRPRHLDRMW
ncbi:hypothetical protein LLS1_36160 [Leifsonia sp. LS1]|nr:hypothetical protein LLS1_36160 [Leifsonia sp. LS1]